MEIPVVRGLRPRPVSVPLPRPVHTASGSIEQAPLVLLDLETDAGVFGHSYVCCYTPVALQPAAELINDLSTLVVGRPLAPLTLERELHDRFRLLGGKGLAGMAIAAVDIAAWDALARWQDLPLVRLLGGEPRAVPAYESLGMLTREEAPSVAEECRENGFTAVKIKLGAARQESDRAVLEALREAGGPDLAIMVDYNQSLDLAEATIRIRDIAGLRPAWVEEPLRADDDAGHARLARSSPVPMQLGENWRGVADMAASLAAQASHYGMPDVVQIGGVSAWLRAAALGEAHRLPLSSHLYPDISAHLLPVTPTAHWLEHLDFAAAVRRQPLELRDGAVRAREEPGLGLEWDEEAVRRFEA